MILPQAVRRVIPPLLNGFISLRKDVALVSILGPLEAFRVAQIEGIDLEVRPHQAVALIGASGSCTSTLLRCMDLLEEIDDGDVFLDGEVITDPVDPVAVLAHGAKRAVAEARASELPARFGLAGREDYMPDRLSGGQQQRVAIIRALAGQPRTLLLDEVTSALDPDLVGEVLGLLRELKESGMTMVIATHEMSFAREVADRVDFLHEGRIVESGPIARGARARRDAGGSCAACWRAAAYEP